MKNPDKAAEHLFGEALDQPPEQRSAFLDRMCRGQPDLRKKVEELLKENDRLQGFMSQPPFAQNENPGKEAATQSLPKGMQLGRYSVVELLGSGGRAPSGGGSIGAGPP